ncbi:MAG: hypothetical protein QOF14_1640 [Hyphomicrobiales bacterium]|jgi:hypothetical protein|nr:hypothetical protein [Hyphomicrobiales bacterium]
MTAAAFEARRFRITIRLTCTEHAQLLNESQRTGFTPSALIRHALTRERPPRAARRPPVEKTRLASILAKLGGTGEVLRQLLAAAREAETVLLIERDLSRALAELGFARKSLMAALGRRDRA